MFGIGRSCERRSRGWPARSSHAVCSSALPKMLRFSFLVVTLKATIGEDGGQWVFPNCQFVPNPPKHSSTTITTNPSLRIRPIALVDVAVHPASPRRKQGHGNDRVWKAWKAKKPASHPSHTLWKSLRDSHIPTASTTGYVFSCHLNPNHRHRKGLVTDVSGPQRNGCTGTLTLQRMPQSQSEDSYANTQADIQGAVSLPGFRMEGFSAAESQT